MYVMLPENKIKLPKRKNKIKGTIAELKMHESVAKKMHMEFVNGNRIMALLA